MYVQVCVYVYRYVCACIFIYINTHIYVYIERFKQIDNLKKRLYNSLNYYALIMF